MQPAVALLTGAGVLPRFGEEDGAAEGEGLVPAALDAGTPSGAAGTPGQRPQVVWQ